MIAIRYVPTNSDFSKMTEKPIDMFTLTDGTKIAS